MPTTQARRAYKAKRIIKQAYGVDGQSIARYELLGSSVAVAVVRRSIDDEPRVSIWVARRLSNGRAIRMRKNCRDGFLGLKDQIAYFESLYAKYGAPN